MDREEMKKLFFKFFSQRIFMESLSRDEISSLIKILKFYNKRNKRSKL